MKHTKKRGALSLTVPVLAADDMVQKGKSLWIIAQKRLGRATRPTI